MDCREDLDFHDDSSSRVAEKAKESILLMKRKMFRSHDLILQYNNKLKEFDRLKEDLFASREEATQFKQESDEYRTKVIKLESQITDYKTNRQELESKIANQDIKIASDKCHLEQLICKLEGLKDKHSGMLIEADVQKSSLEGKIKELEQELRKLKKFQTGEAQMLIRSIKPQRGKKSLVKNEIIEKETIDVAVNTTNEYLPAINSKPVTTERSMLTDVSYNTADNIYPIVCDNCESLNVSSIDKFCKIMTNHPPLLGQMVSPPPPRESSFVVASNLDEPARTLAINGSQENRASSLNAVVPEIENLKQKIATLERKMKKRNKQASRESQQACASCCGHSRPSNCCSSHATIHPPAVPNVQPILPTDFMTEFWNRIMNFTKDSSPRSNNSRPTRNNGGRKKLLKPNKRGARASMRRRANKRASSANWEIESDDFTRVTEPPSDNSVARNSLSRALRAKSSEKSKNIIREKENVSLGEHETSRRRHSGDVNFSKISPRRSSTRIHEKSMRVRESEEKMSSSTNERITINDHENFDESSSRNIPRFSKRSSETNPSDAESFFVSKNSTNDESGGALVARRSSKNSSTISKRTVSPSTTHEFDDHRDAIESNRSDDNFNDPSIERFSDDEISAVASTGDGISGGNTRKRKRENSPRATKRTVRTKLLDKLRALKKNSITIGTKGTIQSCIDPASSSRSVVSNESVTVRRSSDSTRNEAIIVAAAKKQRIAHVPKKSLEYDEIAYNCDSPEERESSVTKLRKIVENFDDKSLENFANSRQSMISPSIIDKTRITTIREVDNLNSSNITNDSSLTRIIDGPIENSTSSLEKPAANLSTMGNRREATDSTMISESFVDKTERIVKNSNIPDYSTFLCEKSSVTPDASLISSYSSVSCLDLTTSSRTKFDDYSSIRENDLSSVNDNNLADRRDAPRDNPNETPALDVLRENIDDSLDNSNSQFFADTPDTGNSLASTKGKRQKKMQNIVKELRTRQVLFSPGSAVADQQSHEKINNSFSEDNANDSVGNIDPAAYQRGIRSLGTLLTRYIGDTKKKNTSKEKKLRKIAAVKLYEEADKAARSELDKLADSEEWTSAIHTSVISRLCQVSSRRTVAKCIVDFLIERADACEPLDRTHTPPAPVMTRTQQRIAALINELERDPRMSGISELVRAGIDFNLFKLGHSIQIEVVEAHARMITVIARMRKDRESVRIFCCDAFYFLGRRATNAIHVVLSIWPEVFPAYGSHLGELENCMVHLIRSEQSIKATSIKRLLKDYYNYPECQTQSTVLIEESINALTRKYTGELELLILLVAKREGTGWTYKHVVNGGLLKFIHEPSNPSSLNVLRLLGFVMRAFPNEDEDNAVSSIVEKLCKIIDSTEGSPDVEEGIVSALLSLSRYNSQHDRITDAILKWKPSRAMLTTTIEQLNTFFRSRSVEWWSKRKREKIK